MNQISNIGNVISSAKGITSIGEGNEAGNFVDSLKQVISETNDLQLQSGELAEKFASGEVENIHDVMVAAEKASVSFELVMEVRNKLVEAYREIMRMQI